MDDGAHRWTNRRELLLNQIREIDADVLCVQEAYDFQWEVIADALPGFGYYAVGREDGVREGESCAIFWRDTLAEAPETGTFWLSESPTVPNSKSWDTACTRICSWITLPAGITIANTHWDHLSSRARLESANMLQARFETHDPFVLCGDFNENLLSPELRSLQQWLRPTVTRPTTTFHDFGRDPNGDHIDHIFISKSLKCESTRIVASENQAIWTSDHFPVVAEIVS